MGAAAIRRLLATAVAAANSNPMINTTAHTRTEVRDAIQHRQETVLGLTWHDLPVKCPPASVLEQLLTTSLALEERCLGSTTSPGLHRSGFNDYVQRQQYCFVDTEAVLMDPEWSEFLRDKFAA